MLVISVEEKQNTKETSLHRKVEGLQEKATSISYVNALILNSETSIDS